MVTFNVPLDVSGSLGIGGGELNLAATGNKVGSFFMSGGQLGDTTNVQGSLVVEGIFDWIGGSFFAPVSQSPVPRLKASAGSTDNISGADNISNQEGVVNHWTLAIASPISVSYTHLDVYKRQDLVDDGSAGSLTITSTGMLTKALTSGTAAVGIPVDISGSVDVPAGVLNLGDPDETDASGSVGGQIVVAAGALLDLEGVNLGAAASSSGSGTIELNGTCLLYTSRCV